MSLEDLAKLLTGQAGVIVTLLGIGILGAKRIWVWGYQLAEEKERVAEAQKREKEWQDLYLQAMAQAAHATGVVGTLVERVGV